MNIVEAIRDKNLFGPLFRDLSTWRAWIVCLKSVFGLKMTAEEVSLFRQCTGRVNPPKTPFKEVYLVVGRRGGKSFVTSVIAVFLAVFRDYRKSLAPGERGSLVIIATDRRQAQIILRYTKAILALPLFKPYVENEKLESIELTNRINIEVHSCSFRGVRGLTIVAAIFEESAFWRIEGANPDSEVYVAVKPAMSTIPNALLLSISTPYSRQGLLYESHREFYGKDDSDEVLVWKAPSITMNPTLSERMIEREKSKDPSAGRAEWDAEFREDLEAFLPFEVIQKVVVSGRLELPPVERTRYVAFVDPSGGGADAFALSVGHRDGGGKIVQDLLRGRKGDPREIVKDYADVLKKYGVREVTGDKYAGAWVSGAFKSEGITYRASELNKSELYLEALPYVSSGSVELLDNRDLIKELRLLERRRGASGKDVVDHPTTAGGSARDDLANVTCGLITIGNERRASPGVFFVGAGPPSGLTEEQREARIERLREEKQRRAESWLMGE